MTGVGSTGPAGRWPPRRRPLSGPRATGPAWRSWAALGLLLAAHGAAAQTSDRQVALTFDDLPATHGTCDAEELRTVTRRLTRTLGARGIPVAGLVTPGRPCLTREILSSTLGAWLEIGAVLGNHTATHPDLNATRLEDYLADLDRGQALIDAAVPTEGRWFRPPMLHAGDEPAKKQGLAAHLAKEGYRVAVVTVDNQEWVYAAVYARARERGDSALAARVVNAYMRHLEASMAFYEALSVAVLGREIPQVLLLHANLLNAEHLDRVLAMLAGRGYRFVGLPDAVADPAYRRPDTYVGPRGLSWLQRWALEAGVPVPPEPREADWIAEAFRSGG